MSIKLGVHTGPQDMPMEDLIKLWRMADEAGFYWVSVWDHFYANPLQDRNNPCYEGVASMAALAALTKNVRVGCLMFCALFRNPGLLAKSIVTIDHISNGRAELGLGGGWLEEEFNEFGYPFPPIKERLDQLEEALQVMRSMLRQPSTTFKGKYYDIPGAVISPKPVNPNLRIWIGGRGPKRTPRIAAQYGDGFNVPYISPEGYRERLDVVDECCAKFGRNPQEVFRTVNCQFHMGTDAASIEEGKQRVSMYRGDQQGGALVGDYHQVIDRIGEYIEAGAQGLNIAFRPPINWKAYETYIEKVLPVFHKA